MSDPLMVLALVAAALTGVTFILSRVVPDRYDHMTPQRVQGWRNDPL